MTKEQVNRLAMSLGFPYDHSKGEVKDLDKLVRLVNCVLDSEVYKIINQKTEINK